MIKTEDILSELNIPEADVLNIYPYGSKVYGTQTEDSDSDFIIVYKSAFLPNGAFRNNAISSPDRQIQAVCYSRTGFQDAINNYEIGALECIFMPEELILKKKWPFKVNKWDIKELCKKIISKASDSWHVATMQFKDGETEMAQRGVYHALRILEFGIQLKEYGKIINYGIAKEIKDSVFNEEQEFIIYKWIPIRDEKMNKLR